MAVTINASTSAGAVTTADTSGVLQLQTGGTTALTVNASQNVGIGVVPSASWGTYKVIQLGEQGVLSGYATGAGVLNIGANFYWDGSGYKYLTTNPATLYQQNAGSHNWRVAASGTADAAVSFNTAMTLDTSGNLLVGTTSPISVSGVTGTNSFSTSTSNSWALSVQHSTSGSSPWGIAVLYSASAPNNTTQNFYWATDTGAQRFSVRSNGGIANYSANDVNLSDRREKTNFAPAKSYLDVICAIPVQTFNYIDQNMEEDGGLTLGVVAQDVQAVAPEMVMESNWGTQEDPKMRLSIYQTDLQYALMKCIQEQQTLITALTARITALEGAAA